MRTFIAIPLPVEVREFLRVIQNQLKACGADVKWVEPENIHLTLKFLGEISDDQLSQVNVILGELSKDTLSFTVAICSIGAFPRITSPRVIWAGIDKGDKKVKDTTKRLEERLSLIGIPKEERRFSSHITIGRTRSGLNLDKLAGGLEKISLLDKDQRREFQASKITLFKSTLTPKGPIYAILKEASLKTN
ncbi:MAG: RNA 2',3'-cyclic phosphodiesterase [Candidatus Omnitrophota bacterium]